MRTILGLSHEIANMTGVLDVYVAVQKPRRTCDGVQGVMGLKAYNMNQVK